MAKSHGSLQDEHASLEIRAEAAEARGGAL